jgi:elongation factor Ts
VIRLLEWDEETYRPGGAAETRAQQLAIVEGMKHELLASDRLGDLIGAVGERAKRAPKLEAELRRLARLRRAAIALPATLVAAYAESRSYCLTAWERARQKNDFGVFAKPFGLLLTLLRERGMADASKRAHRAAAEGTIAAAQNGDHSAAALVELNCETDFVAKTPQFQALAEDLAQWVMNGSADAVSTDDVPADKQADIQQSISKTGENIQFRRGTKVASGDGVVEYYIHLGGKIGVLVQVDGAQTDEVRGLAKDLAMQVAAASPDYLSREDVPQDVIDREMEIYRTQGRNEGKKEEFLDRIAQGRLEKFYKDNCLVEQPFIKDPDKQIKALVAETGKAVGAELTVKRFIRYQLGQ